MNRYEEMADLLGAIIERPISAEARARLITHMVADYPAEAIITELVTTISKWQRQYFGRFDLNCATQGGAPTPISTPLEQAF